MNIINTAPWLLWTEHIARWEQRPAWGLLFLPGWQTSPTFYNLLLQVAGGNSRLRCHLSGVSLRKGPTPTGRGVGRYLAKFHMHLSTDSNLTLKHLSPKYTGRKDKERGHEAAHGHCNITDDSTRLGITCTGALEGAWLSSYGTLTQTHQQHSCQSKVQSLPFCYGIIAMMYY